METHSLHYTHANGWSSAFPSIDSTQTLVLIFGPANWLTYQIALQALIAAYPQSVILGCSGYGAIQTGEVLDETLTVNITRFEHTQLRLTTSPVKTHNDSIVAGQALAQELNHPSLKAILVLSDGLITNGAKLTEALNKNLANPVVMVGGLAGDSQNFKATWVIANQLPQGQLACAVGFYGEAIRFHSAIRAGWSPFGPERQVTSVSGNKLYTLDNKPALELYKQYLGDRANDITKTSLHFPLAIRPKNKPYILIRTPMVLDEDSQTLIFAGDIPEQSTAQLVHVSVTSLVDGAYEASEQLASMLGPNPPQELLLLTISCGARRALMAEEASLELHAVCSALPEGVHQIGYYSFGELAPHQLQVEPKGSKYCASGDCQSCLALPTYGICELHNQTITLTAIYEQEASLAIT